MSGKPYCVFLFILLLSSCGEAETPAAIITATNITRLNITREITNTKLEIPTHTPTPSSTNLSFTQEHTPTIPLEKTILPGTTSEGPYLVFTNIPGPIKNFILITPDGSGRKIIHIAEKDIFLNGYSPNGEWGVLSQKFDSGDIDLKLIHLPDGNIKYISSIISWKELDPEYSWWWGTTCQMPEGLFSQASWSPNGRYLAFSANTSGKSFDLFTYDTEQDVLRRLTNQTADILSIAWSGDGKYIIFENGIQADGYGGYYSYTINVTQPENNPNQDIRTVFIGTDAIGMYPVTDHHDIIITASEKLGCTAGGIGSVKSLLLVNYETGENQEIWSGNIHNYAVDFLNGTVLLFGKGSGGDAPQGYYLVSFSGDTIISLDLEGNTTHNKLYYRGGKKYSYIIQENDNSLVMGITSGGAIEVISKKQESLLSISRDNKLFIVYNQREMELYSEGDIKILEIKYDIGEPLYWIPATWNPDGGGVYLAGKESEEMLSLNYWSFADNVITKIMTCSILSKECGFYQLTWIL